MLEIIAVLVAAIVLLVLAVNFLKSRKLGPGKPPSGTGSLPDQEKDDQRRILP